MAPKILALKIFGGRVISYNYRKIPLNLLFFLIKPVVAELKHDEFLYYKKYI